MAQTGGHLSSNLGTVELTIALHYVFDTPRDRIVWDVGHQTYAHKILTGRRADMSRLRMAGGPSGFPRRSESEYDTFGTAHSSTSISAALGMAIAAQRNGDPRSVVAVIGDGAMSAGMAFEALNNAGIAGADLLVILNDNEMSISEPVGALNGYLAKLLASRLYNTVRRGGKEVLSKLPPMKELAKRWEEHMKGMVLPGTLFEEFGFNYIGPIDGHDVDMLANDAREREGAEGPATPARDHEEGLRLRARRGCPDPLPRRHEIRPGDRLSRRSRAPSPPTRRSSATGSATWRRPIRASSRSRRRCARARASCASPRNIPERYFDVGIAEQHAVTFAAGLACEGMKPVVAIYSTFLQRAYDQLIHDVALQNLPVVFAIDRAGIVGADGATHLGAFDLSYLRCLPNMTVMAPADENECRQMLYTAFKLDTPTAVRYPRGSGPGVAVAAAMTALPVGKGEVRRTTSRRTNRIAILAFGSMLAPALGAAEELDATVANMRFVKPLDVDLVSQLALEHDMLVTIEENVVAGGAGSAVGEALAAHGILIPLLQLGLPDAFVDHGDPAQLLANCGLDVRGVVASVNSRFGQRRTDPLAKPAA